MIMDRKLYYLASPYSHKDASVRKQRANDVTESAVDLLHHGIFTFAPISSNEPWEQYSLPGDWTFWCEFDKAFIERCDAVIVLMLDGWDKSVGVNAEIEFAKEIGKPVFYITKEQIKSKNTVLSKLNLNPSDSMEDLVTLFCSQSKL